MLLHLRSLITFLIIIYLETANGYEYCKPEVHSQLCKKNNKHIVCDSTAFAGGTPPASAAFVAFLPLTRKVRNYYLELVNQYRDIVASGLSESSESQKKFPVAARMREIIWDNELAYLAMQHASRIRLGDAQCSTTLNYRTMSVSFELISLNFKRPFLGIIEQVINMWYKQRNKVSDPEGSVNVYSPGPSGDFYKMIHELTSKMGCSIAVTENCTIRNRIPYCWYVFCYYNTALRHKKPVYKIHSNSASDCGHWGTGKSKKYPNLCKNDGKDYPIPK